MHEGHDRRGNIRAVIGELGDEYLKRVKAAKTILIKVNLIDHRKQLAVTHVDAVRGVLDATLPHTNARIYIGDAGYTGTKSAFQHFGYEHLTEHPKVELVDLNEDEWVEGVSVRADGSENPVRRSKLAAEADFTISLAPMKTHHSAIASLSVENWVHGTWIVPARNSANGRIFARWPWLEEQGAYAHHASIARMFKDLTCDLALIDGYLAMQGDGPVDGGAIEMNVAFGGFDPVAVDSVGSILMGLDPSDVGYLAMLAESSDHENDMSEIDAPPLLLSQLKKTFTFPAHFAEHLRDWQRKS